MATPARPSPRSSSIWVISPPIEWPIRIGGVGQRPHEGVVVIDYLAEADIGRCLGVVEFLVEFRYARPRRRMHDVARRDR